MKSFSYAYIIVLFLSYGCSNNSRKDISKSSFYWVPKEVDKNNLLNKEFFSEIHENNLGKYVFANETIERSWEDVDEFVTSYDMSKLDEEGLFCRLFVNQNAGPDKIYESLQNTPSPKKSCICEMIIT